MASTPQPRPSNQGTYDGTHSFSWPCWLTASSPSTEIVNTIRTLGDEIRAIASKAGQLERDSEEHSSVRIHLVDSSDHDHQEHLSLT
jgi:hypothetical protein